MSYIFQCQEQGNKNCISQDVITCPVYAIRLVTHGKNNYLRETNLFTCLRAALFILLRNLSRSQAVRELSVVSQREGVLQRDTVKAKTKPFCPFHLMCALLGLSVPWGPSCQASCYLSVCFLPSCLMTQKMFFFLASFLRKNKIL